MYLIDINKEIEFKAWDYRIITMPLKSLSWKAIYRNNFTLYYYDS